MGLDLDTLKEVNSVWGHTCDPRGMARKGRARGLRLGSVCRRRPECPWTEWSGKGLKPQLRGVFSHTPQCDTQRVPSLMMCPTSPSSNSALLPILCHSRIQAT